MAEEFENILFANRQALPTSYGKDSYRRIFGIDRMADRRGYSETAAAG
jgi:hypothetical protein